ncbi:hypothetical protein N7495_007969, partial [Penicillium taxi]|uniref:uncharacterized protein n=1 Tax=Penicillium taxi TaxID=168475 RepID=UPI0025455B88
WWRSENMGDVHSRRSPPFPSPTESVSQPYNIHPRSPQFVENARRSSLDAFMGVEASAKFGVRMPHFSRGDSVEHIMGLASAAEDSRSGSERQEEQGKTSQTLQELRRQMEELLVYQQMQQNQHHTSLPQSASNVNDPPRKRRLSSASTADSAKSASSIEPTPKADPITSTGTIKADETNDQMNPVQPTPSYPFPRVTHHPNPSPEQTARQAQFRLKLPSDKDKSPEFHSAKDPSISATEPLGLKAAFSPPTKDIFEEFPSPDIYNLVLKLNADAGLDRWWSNLVDILRTDYGTERASLAVPGDATDLENVPWGQKATFNPRASCSTESDHLYTMDNGTAPETPSGPSGRKLSDEWNQKQNGAPAAQSRPQGATPVRPSFSSRHSFAGFGHVRGQVDQDRHSLLKSATGRLEKKHARIVETPSAEAPLSSTEKTPKAHAQAKEHQHKYMGMMQLTVFPTLRQLEVEPDPLIKRTGVVSLFGRSGPVVLTRDYEESMQNPQHSVMSPLDTVQVTPTAEEIESGFKGTGDMNMFCVPSIRRYDEYEQIPQSPWSQSPAPSPAPRSYADQNPFFLSHAVDEGAFEQNPPEHDYANTLPLEAIGIDHSKTIIHIPLLYSDHSGESASPTLRFPVAVISLLSSIVPYPPNLRQSLAQLMPHLTTSFRLAQQYSQLERQLNCKVELPRYGNLLGLGGTFSDASSEMELVAGLSGHMNYSVGDDNSMSARASLASPSDNSSMKFSPALSSYATPYEHGHFGFGSATQSPGLNPRSGDGTDGYFNVQHPKPPTQHRHRLSKSRVNLASSTPTSPGPRMTAEDSANDPSLTAASPLHEMRSSTVLSSAPQPSRQASTGSYYSQLQRELPRPFSDTIAQLMLNSIPLHLCLAKPQGGEVIWTNAKFDAYRRSKPQEQKSRDIWQNIHSNEREIMSNKWAIALRTGSQFTERVRVRRYNDENAYRWFIFRANPLLSAAGEVLYWIGSFLDIHEQHIAELKATQEREKFATDAKYRAFSNSIPQIVFEATEQRGLIFVNEQWNLYTGQRLEDAADLGFTKHVHPDDLEKCGGLCLKKQRQTSPSNSQSAQRDNAQPQSFAEIYAVSDALNDLVKRGVASLQKDENGRVFYSTEIRLRSRGGDFRWHLVRLVCVEIGSFGSEEASWYGTCTDINDRKNLERDLNKAMRQLNNQMESKTKFFSNMSHEIRTPLNGILGTIPFILDTQVDSDQRRMLDTIQNSSTNLRELVDNILDVSRVEAGKMSLVISWFHVRSMIEDVIDTVASRAIDKGLEINYLMDADVPSMVIGDRFRIRQILINLVGNAVKFTARGEIYIRCSLYHGETASAKTKETEIFLNFQVVDTGKGFNSQDAELLMQRFSQVGETVSQQHAGSGLGLFLSKQLVEMHGGMLKASAQEGQGAKFSFNVKLDAPQPPSPSESPQVFRQSSTSSRRPGLSRLASYEQQTLGPLRPFDGRFSDPSTISPGLDSIASQSPMLSEASAVSIPKSSLPLSMASAALPTPDIVPAPLPPALDQSNFHTVSQKTANVVPDVNSVVDAPIRPAPIQAAASPSKFLGPAIIPPSQGPFSIYILCTLKNTRTATKQHIEQVVPHEIPFKITTLPDVDEWKDMMQSGTNADCTHLVLNLPATDDILDVIQNMSASDPRTAPVVVIISDLYQKRQISPQVKALAATGKQVFIVPKPVKPSAFSTIFDPESKRELSKDRNQDMAREINNNFKTMSKMVKEQLGNKGYRILLVEDDETNRGVMLKYLDKIKLMSETASNGKECTDMVFSKEPGYYSLIICDIQMPIKNGYDTCRDIRAWELKNHYPQIPIMALSANAMTDQIEHAARAGFNDYVTKPIKHNELGQMMMGLLDTNRPLLLLRDRLNSGSENPLSTRR